MKIAHLSIQKKKTGFIVYEHGANGEITKNSELLQSPNAVYGNILAGASVYVSMNAQIEDVDSMLSTNPHTWDTETRIKLINNLKIKIIDETPNGTFEKIDSLRKP